MPIAGLGRRKGRTQGHPKPRVWAMAEDFCPRISADWVGVNVLAQMALTACPCTLPDPCQNHHCKHGKVCELDENNTPMCVCQDPTSCPAPIGEFEKVSTDERGRGDWALPNAGRMCRKLWAWSFYRAAPISEVPSLDLVTAQKWR